jgi:nucleoside-diphosphate-sugar epimerase
VKTVLITGASGFIGRFLIEEALKRNFKVVAAVRKATNKEFIQLYGIESLLIDLSNKQAIMEAIQKSGFHFDFVIHNAGLTQGKKEDYYLVNTLYTKNFIEALTESKNIPQKFIYTSSQASYGAGNEVTFQPISITDLQNPVTHYGQSKLEAEQIIKTSILPYIIFLPTAVYGPGERNLFLIFKTIKLHFEIYFGRNHQFLSFIYVKDLARLYFDAIEAEMTNKSYIISDGNTYTTQELNTYIRNFLNKKTVKIHFPIWLVECLAFINEKISLLTGKASIFNIDKVNELKSRNWKCDIRPVQSDFSFKSQYNLDKGISETVQWYKQQGWL